MHPGQIEGPCKKVIERMVEEALGRMKTRKAAGPTGVTADLLEVVGEDCVRRLMDVANGLLGGARMPESWRRSDLLPLHKGKGDTRSCSSYRSVKLLEHAMKVIEKFFEQRLRKNVVRFLLEQVFYGRMPLLTPTTVISSGPSLCLKRNTLQGNMVAEVVHETVARVAPLGGTTQLA